jgi:7-cyano-7-deazaguanine reductase
MYEDREPTSMEKKAQKTVGVLHEPEEIDTSILESFPYQYPHREITVEYVTTEFTSVCPYSGLPDFATLTIRYTPDKDCIELKSLKYYLYAWRQVRMFNEHVVNKILEDLIASVKPRRMEIVGAFTNRGGIINTVTATYDKR